MVSKYKIKNTKKYNIKNKYNGGGKLKTFIEKVKKLPEKNIFLKSLYNVIIYGDMFVPYSPIEKLGYLTELTKSVVKSHKTSNYKIIEWDELNKYKESIRTVNSKQKLTETDTNTETSNVKTTEQLMFLHNIKIIIPYTNKRDITISVNYNDFDTYLRQLFDNDITKIMYNIDTNKLNYNEKFMFMIIFMIKQIKIELNKLKSTKLLLSNTNNTSNTSKIGGGLQANSRKRYTSNLYTTAGPVRKQPIENNSVKTNTSLNEKQQSLSTFKVEGSKIVCQEQDEKISEFLEKYLIYLKNIENVNYCPNIKELLLELESITDIDNLKNIYIKIISIWKKKMYYNIMSNFSSFNKLNTNLRSITFPLLYFSKDELEQIDTSENGDISSNNSSSIYSFFGNNTTQLTTNENTIQKPNTVNTMTGGFGFTYQSLGIGKYMKGIDSVIESKYLVRHSDLGINKYNQSHIDSLLNHVIDDISVIVKADKKEKKKTLKKLLKKSAKHTLKRAFSFGNNPNNTTEVTNEARSYIKGKTVKETLKSCFSKIDDNLINAYKTHYLQTIEDVPEIQENDIDDINDKFKIYCKLDFKEYIMIEKADTKQEEEKIASNIIEKADTNFINCLFSIINKILEISIKQLNIPLYRQHMDVEQETNKTLLNYNKLLNGTLKKSKMKSHYVKYLSFINLILELFITDNFQIIQLFLDEFYELIFNTSDINGIISQYSEFIKKNKENFEKIQIEQTKQVAKEIETLQSESLISS